MVESKEQQRSVTAGGEIREEPFSEEDRKIPPSLSQRERHHFSPNLPVEAPPAHDDAHDVFMMLPPLYLHQGV
jgi:hypothetical protein